MRYSNFFTFPLFLSLIICSSTAVAQPGTWDWSELITNSNANKELEMIGPQIEEAREMYESEYKRFSAIIKEVDNRASLLVDNNERRQILIEMKAKRREFQESIRNKMEDILLPHQIERLQQLVAWVKINSFGYATTITTNPLMKVLGFNPQTTNKVRKDAASLQGEFEKELFKLRIKYQERLKKELTDEQRKKLIKLLGEDSMFQTTPLGF